MDLPGDATVVVCTYVANGMPVSGVVVGHDALFAMCALAEGDACMGEGRAVVWRLDHLLGTDIALAGLGPIRPGHAFKHEGPAGWRVHDLPEKDIP